MHIKRECIWNPVSSLAISKWILVVGQDNLTSDYDRTVTLSTRIPKSINTSFLVIAAYIPTAVSSLEIRLISSTSKAVAPFHGRSAKFQPPCFQISEKQSKKGGSLKLTHWQADSLTKHVVSAILLGFKTLLTLAYSTASSTILPDRNWRKSSSE